MDPGISLRYHRGALVRGLRPLGLLLCLEVQHLLGSQDPGCSYL
jgi:hypothetical protein